jgi:spermidine synthase
LFSLPVTLLGTISPFAIRLAIRDSRHAGQISGRIYAISTLGSFIGTFLPVLVLIPLVGTTATFLFFSFFLLLVAIFGMWISTGRQAALRMTWMLVVLIFLALLLGGGAIKETPGQLFETESAYNYIEVLEMDGGRYLRLNEGQGIHSIWHPTEVDYQGPWEQFLAAPFLNSPPYKPNQVESMAIVGLAAGTVARQATLVFGPIPIDGFEIDPEIIAVARQYFDMNQPNLNAIAQDGRWGLATSKRRYTVIGIDAYRPPYIPWHLTTQEFFRIVNDHLVDDGVMVINVGRSPSDRRLLDGLVGTIETVFPSVYVMDIPGSFNSIIYATVQPTVIENIFDNLVVLSDRSDVHPLLIEAMKRVIIHQKPTPNSNIVFSDDWAPIEWITNNMVLNYVFFGDIEGLEGVQP